MFRTTNSDWLLSACNPNRVAQALQLQPHTLDVSTVTPSSYPLSTPASKEIRPLPTLIKTTCPSCSRGIGCSCWKHHCRYNCCKINQTCIIPILRHKQRKSRSARRTVVSYLDEAASPGTFCRRIRTFPTSKTSPLVLNNRRTWCGLGEV